MPVMSSPCPRHLVGIKQLLKGKWKPSVPHGPILNSAESRSRKAQREHELESPIDTLRIQIPQSSLWEEESPPLPFLVWTWNYPSAGPASAQKTSLFLLKV